MIINKPHQRFNTLNGEWVLVSPHRALRPWQGGVEKNNTDKRPAYDEKCYLCPGNLRAGGKTNPEYQNTYVFENDFAALMEFELPDGGIEDKLIKFQPVSGTCRVICFSPRHDLSLAEMEIAGIEKVINLWIEQTVELGKKYKWVQIFENKGEVMGCSNPHPHGQIWAGSTLPNEAAKEEKQQLEYFRENKSVLLADYIEFEIREQERVIFENKNWIVVVPYWALWPFETLLISKNNKKYLTELDQEEISDLSTILKQLLVKYDNLFNVSFPYTMGWHQAPFNNGNVEHWRLHAHFYPPLLRSATVKKFMVGYEMLAQGQRDITPEAAAEKLKELSDIHYLIK